MELTLFLGIFAIASSTYAQSLLNATAPYAQLSDFNALLRAFPDVASSLLTNISSGPEKQTVLVPDNDAFNRYRQRAGASVSSLSSSDVGNILNYHTLQGSLSSSDLQTPGGLVSNTALTNTTYDNREVPTGGGKLSQVVFISSSDTSEGPQIKARQLNALSSVDLKSGEGAEITLQPTPGNWSGGTFYVVDGFLTLPVNQTDTMTAQGLTDFVRGLNRTNVSDPTNAAPGLTCLCPENGPFGALANSIGNLTDGPASLLATLTRHGLTGSYYTTNFSDGDLIHSQNGYPILVTRRNGSIFLNDAKLTSSNNIANTGAVHALDRIMGFLNVTTNITTPANASIYSNTSNIPSPTPITTTSSIASGGAIPTGTSATGGGAGAATPTGASGGGVVSAPAGSGTPTPTGGSGSMGDIRGIEWIIWGLMATVGWGVLG